MPPLLFTLGGLTINVTADNISLDNYTSPPIRSGILLETTMSIDTFKKTFAYLTSTPSISLMDSLTSVQYVCLKQNVGTLASPIYSFDDIIPHLLTVGLTLPAEPGYTLSHHTSQTSINKSMEYDLMQYIAINLLFTDSEINTAIAAVDKKLPNGSKLSDSIPGIVNSGNFRKNFLDKVKSGFGEKLAKFGVNETGEGTPYSATPPTDQSGVTEDFHPSLEMARNMFNNESSRLETIGTPIANAAALGVKAGLSAFGIPAQIGDVLDFCIVVTSNQKSKSETTIATRTYRIRTTLVT
jgi:hypothetical protein